MQQPLKVVLGQNEKPCARCRRPTPVESLQPVKVDPIDKIMVCPTCVTKHDGRNN